MKIDEKFQSVVNALHAESRRAFEEIKASFGLHPDDDWSSEGTCVIIDAESEASEALAEYLAVRGIQVWTTPSGEEALRVIRQVRPALVLADLKPEGIGGLPLLARIRRFSPGSRIIILTGWTFPYIEPALREFQVDAFCLKPASVETVQRIIVKTLHEPSLIGE